MEYMKSLLYCAYIWMFLLTCDNVHGSTQSFKHSVKPNVIFFLIDDWGYNDVGYYGNTDTQTPFINKLVEEESLRIDKYYVMPECTATRCALLTGRYPMRYGLQDGILYYQSPYALSGNEYLLSSEFQQQGYSTHLVGKWHLGMMAEEYTPTYRGFDTFLGFYAGLIYYYSHYGIEDSYPNKKDFHDGTDNWEEEGRYTMYTYQDRILNIIDESQDKEDPFFLYIGWQGSHYPSEAPDDYVNMYNTDSATDSRKHFQAQTTLTDELMEELVTHLKDTGVWEDTLLVVASDNGADWGFGDNSPLRGSKFTLWEGGIRVPAFITGGYLPETRKGDVLSDIPIHVTDWYPTLLSAAGLNTESPNQLDGKNLWKFFENGEEERVDEVLAERVIVLNADKHGCGTDLCGAVLYGGRWKLVTGTNQLVSWESGEPEVDTCFWHRDFSIDESKDVLRCGVVPDGLVTETCSCSRELCLFDLENDPCEYHNVYNENLDIATKLTGVLDEYYKEQSIVLFDSIFNVATVIAAKGTPDGYWEPWANGLEDFTSWDNLQFEQMLAPYYKLETERIEAAKAKTAQEIAVGKNENDDDNDENDDSASENEDESDVTKEEKVDKSLNALWIGLTVAALGVFIFIIFIIWRLCFVRRMERHSQNLKRQQERGARIDESKTTLKPNLINSVNVNGQIEEERLPLKQNQVGSINSYN